MASSMSGTSSERSGISGRRAVSEEGGRPMVKRGPWTAEEDELLQRCVMKDGEGKWRTLPARAGLKRCGKSCRLRWMNYLRPQLKRGNISPDEEDLILRLHRLLGNRWSLIAGRIPGRTDNEIKNYWNTHLSKKLISQGIDPRTHKPLLQDHAHHSKPLPSSSVKPKLSIQTSTPATTCDINLAASSSEESPLDSQVSRANVGDVSHLDKSFVGGIGARHNQIQVPKMMEDDDHNSTGGSRWHWDVENNEDTDDTYLSSFLNSLISDDPSAPNPQQQQINLPAAAATASDCPMALSSGSGSHEYIENQS